MATFDQFVASLEAEFGEAGTNPPTLFLNHRQIRTMGILTLNSAAVRAIVWAQLN